MAKTYEEIFSGEYARIPDATKEALWAWVQHGQRGGDFLDALIANDLMGVFAHADDLNRRYLPIIVLWLFNRAPAGCFVRTRQDINEKMRALDWPGLVKLLALTIELEYPDDDGEMVTVKLPAKRVPCPRCPDGTVDIFEGGVTEDMREDPDFDEDYAAGRYSKPCPKCNGKKTVFEPDESAMTEQQRLLYAKVQEHQRFEAKCRAEERYEKRMGC